MIYELITRNYPGLIDDQKSALVAQCLPVRFNTRYVWIGFDVSREHSDWIGSVGPDPTLL